MVWPPGWLCSAHLLARPITGGLNNNGVIFWIHRRWAAELIRKLFWLRGSGKLCYGSPQSIHTQQSAHAADADKLAAGSTHRAASTSCSRRVYVLDFRKTQSDATNGYIRSRVLCLHLPSPDQWWKVPFRQYILLAKKFKGERDVRRSCRRTWKCMISMQKN